MSTDTAPALTINNLTKTFGTTTANSNISVRLDPGEVTALIGHNGAGKTTFLNQIVGLTKPDAGSISYGGTDLIAHPTQARQICAIMPQVTSSLEGVTPRQAIATAVRSLTGRIRQTPPLYSAVKIGGRRACDLARTHHPVTLAAREVEIYRLEVLAQGEDTLLLDVDCSKGTYIRALCRDLGAALDIPATMSFLVRRRVGAFHLEAAHSLEELGDLGEAAVKAPELYLGHLPRYLLPAARAAAFTRGLSTHDPHYDGAAGSLAVYGAEDFLGVGHYEAESASIVPDKVYRIPV